MDATVESARTTGRDLRFLLRPRWLAFHLLVVVGVVVMINLSMWQFSRLEERRDFNATIEARYDVPAAPLDVVLAEGEPDEVEWRSVTTSGTYLADGTIAVVNRSQGGRAGDSVVTPLLLDDGRILLVNRGFVPLGVDPPAAPSGPVEVTGELRRSEQRRTGQLSDPAEGELTEVQRVDLERLAPQLDGEVVPMWLMLEASRPAESDVLEPVARPELTERNHLSYGVQWLIFAAAVVVGWVLAVRRSIATRRREASAPPDDGSSEPGPSAAVSGRSAVDEDRPGPDGAAATTAPNGTAPTSST